MIGNEYTGDVSAVKELCDTFDVGGSNWIKGTAGKFKFCAKVFATQSTYGINNGRISKLQICDTSQDHWGWDKTYVNYDRGWDIIPDDVEAITFLNAMLNAMGDKIFKTSTN